MLTGAPATRAQESSLQQYDVELIIFSVTNPSGSVEDWQVEEARAKGNATATAVEGEEPNNPANAGVIAEGNDSSVQPLAAAQFKMSPLETTLRRNRNYQVLTHIGWTQPGFALNNPRPLAVDSLIPPEAAVTGTVSLTRGRYLRLVMNLKWQAPDGKRYVLREQRRLAHSGEKHYFDHPYFGVIALVTPKG